MLIAVGHIWVVYFRPLCFQMNNDRWIPCKQAYIFIWSVNAMTSSRACISNGSCWTQRSIHTSNILLSAWNECFKSSMIARLFLSDLWCQEDYLPACQRILSQSGFLSYKMTTTAPLFTKQFDIVPKIFRNNECVRRAFRFGWTC